MRDEFEDSMDRVAEAGKQIRADRINRLRNQRDEARELARRCLYYVKCHEAEKASEKDAQEDLILDLLTAAANWGEAQSEEGGE